MAEGAEAFLRFKAEGHYDGEPDLEELAASWPVCGAEPEVARSPLEERVLAGFEEIQRWVTEHGRPPRHGEGLDIFERLYAVRLDRIRGDEALRALVAVDRPSGVAGRQEESSADPPEL